MAQASKLTRRQDSPDRPATMADVARLADVSTATVSNFLSGRDDLLKRMSPEVQDRVSAAVARLGYVHNKVARHLRLQRTERLCVLLPRLGIPYADQIATDVEAVARSRGYTTVIVTGHGIDIWRRVANEVEAGLADGLVCDADEMTEAELGELFADGGRASKARLVLHPDAAPNGFSVVNYDRVSALRVALEHLKASGRRRVAYVENRSKRFNVREKLVRDFVADPANGMTLGAVIQGASTRSDAAEAAREVAAMREGIDCVLVESDFAAVTMIEELQRCGVDIPRDMAVIGCGNAPEGYFANPRLTTIGPTTMSLTEATGHLIDRIETRGVGENQRFVLPWSLIRRDSA